MMQLMVDIFIFLVSVVLFLLLIVWTIKFWSMYVSAKFLAGINFIMLEIKLPREIYKSPESMELVLTAMLQGGGVGNWYTRNWKGAVPTFFSLEVASLEGEVKFYVRCDKKFKELITNNFYSQYPGIEITEAEDYVSKIFYEHRSEKVKLWGVVNKTTETITLPNNHKGARKDYYEKIDSEKNDDKKKTLKDELKLKADYKMIKTYVDYKQDKDPKEEFEHDPLSTMLEWLGSLGAGEYGYYQLLVQDAGKFDTKTFPKTYKCEATHEEFTLKELAEERRYQIRNKEWKPKYKKGDKVLDDYGDPIMKNVPDGVDENGKPKSKQVPKTYPDDDKPNADALALKESDIRSEIKDELEGITRKLQKPLLRAAMKIVYIREEDKGTPNHVQSVLAVMRPFTGPGYNGFAPSPSDPYNYAWENTFKRRVPWRTEELFEAYVEREGFYKHIEDRAKATSWLGKHLWGYGVDSWADLALFNYSLGTRKVIRLMYEGFVAPFHHPHPDEVFTLNLEEVASLWHLPGSTVNTPGIKRIDSIKSGAPDNLPR